MVGKAFGKQSGTPVGFAQLQSRCQSNHAAQTVPIQPCSTDRTNPCSTDSALQEGRRQTRMATHWPYLARELNFGFATGKERLEPSGGVGSHGVSSSALVSGEAHFVHVLSACALCPVPCACALRPAPVPCAQTPASEPLSDHGTV